MGSGVGSIWSKKHSEERNANKSGFEHRTSKTFWQWTRAVQTCLISREGRTCTWILENIAVSSARAPGRNRRVDPRRQAQGARINGLGAAHRAWGPPSTMQGVWGSLLVGTKDTSSYLPYEADYNLKVVACL